MDHVKSSKRFKSQNMNKHNCHRRNYRLSILKHFGIVWKYQTENSNGKRNEGKKHTHIHNTIGWNIKDQTFNPYFRMAYTKTDICQLVKYNLMLFVSFFGSLTTSLCAHIHISLTSRTPFIRDFAHFFWRIFYGAWLKERQSNVKSANNNRHKNTCAELQSHWKCSLMYKICILCCSPNARLYHFVRASISKRE